MNNTKNASTQAVKRKKIDKRKSKLLPLLIGFAAAVAVLVLVLLLTGKKEQQVKYYPMEYTDLIIENAEQNGIEPAYVASVVCAESDYDANALSSAGAQGLMQLLPDTAQWIAPKFDEVYVEGCLYTPEVNLKYGCWYLGYLMRRFNNDMTCATAAYHAGQGTVDQWLANPEYSSDGAHLDVVPGERTSGYVERVLEYYEVYSKKYAEI